MRAMILVLVTLNFLTTSCRTRSEAKPEGPLPESVQNEFKDAETNLKAVTEAPTADPTGKEKEAATVKALKEKALNSNLKSANRALAITELSSYPSYSTAVTAMVQLARGEVPFDRMRVLRIKSLLKLWPFIFQKFEKVVHLSSNR